jgi:hypothetical protein
MSIDRREAIRLLAGVSTALALSPSEALAMRGVLNAGTQDAPQFFNPREYRTVRLLADMILPADDRSGSASDVGVPEFIDFMMIDRPDSQLPMRGGLAWLDAESRDRFRRNFEHLNNAEREEILDDIAWGGEDVDRDLAPGVAFFNAFRDLTATGFWTSREGIEDLQYLGNRYRNSWRGCPPEQLRHLGLID